MRVAFSHFPAMVLLSLATAPLSGQSTAAARDPEPSIIRILPPRSVESAGRTLIEALVIEPDIHNVLFYVDGELAERRRFPPWEAKLKLDSPPREQVVRIEAVDENDKVLGSDEILVNRVVRPLRVRIEALETIATGLHLKSAVSVPNEAQLESITVFFNETVVSTHPEEELRDGRLEVDLERPSTRPDDYVRVLAQLEDGRSVEDVSLVAAPGFEEEVDVHLVQLQIVVTNRDGVPITGLEKKHFSIREKGRTVEPAGLFPAKDVSLLLGFAIDSSGSMQRVWRQTREAAASFLVQTISPRDEGFLIDFNTRIRLLQPRTGDRAKLQEAFNAIVPDGGTALYDSILFSMLQFDRQQGRRGLVVLTDGYDVNSQADPNRAVEFGKKLGVPIYILAMEAGGSPRVPPRGGGGASDATSVLHLLTDPTGGRLFRVLSMEHLRDALRIINSEMRNQYVLTYYTDTPPTAGDPPKVRLEVEKPKNFVVKVVFGQDQVY